MPAASELELPRIDPTDPELRGARYRSAMAALEGHDGWLAAQPFGYVTLDRESGEFFLRSRATEFPGRVIASLFGIESGPLHEEVQRNIINLKGADHGRLRGLVNPALAPRRIDRYRPAMRAFLAELAAGWPGDGRIEFVEEFAKPYPSRVIAHVMGAPVADAPLLHRFSNWIQRQFDAGSLTTERDEIERCVIQCYAYIDALIAARRGDPAEDLITDLIAAESSGDRLDHEELRNLILNILVGGVDTSQSQLAHTLRLLAEHPDQWAALRGDPQGLATAAIEEALRYEPITPFTARITNAEVAFRGVLFPAGTIMLISAWHANRDGSGEDRFDITARRPPGRLLTFGAGIHYCVGANLARAEMTEAVAFLAARVGELRLDGEPSFGTPSGIYGLERLPLVLKPL